MYQLQRKLSIIPLAIVVCIHVTVLFFAFRYYGWPVEQALPGALFSYAALALLMASPVGELSLRLLCGARRIKREDWSRKAERALEVVYESAHSRNVRLPENISIYYVYSPLAMSFSFGRTTVCLSSALLDSGQSMIEAFLGHEMGHIKYCDGILLLLANAGNLPWICAGAVLRWVSRGIRAFLMYNRFHVLGLVLFLVNVVLLVPRGCIWLFLSLTRMIFWFGNRRREYEADAFCVRIGLGEKLRTALLSADVDMQNTRDLWQSIIASHPGVHDRIGRIDELMSSCRRRAVSGSRGSGTALIDILNAE